MMSFHHCITLSDLEKKGIYASLETRVSIIEQLFSSIRGLGLLDTIMKDDRITEVMINGAKNIFVEKAGGKEAQEA